VQIYRFGTRRENLKTRRELSKLTCEEELKMADMLPNYMAHDKAFLQSTSKSTTRALKKNGRNRWTKNETFSTEKCEQQINKKDKRKNKNKPRKVTSNDKLDNLCNQVNSNNNNYEEANKERNKRAKQSLHNILNTTNAVEDIPEFATWYLSNYKFKESNVRCYKTYNYFLPLQSKATPLEGRIEEQTGHTEVHQEKKMPLLDQRKAKLPTKVGTDKTNEDDKNQTAGKEGEWQKVNEKDKDKEIKEMTDKISNKLLPKKLPDFGNINNENTTSTSIIIPLSIKIVAPKKTNLKFKSSRVVAAVLQALQNVYFDTYLAPIDADTMIEAISNPKNIPIDESNIKQYLQKSMNARNGVFHGKIYLNTNHKLQEYKTNLELQQYLREENIVIDVNDLDDINPVIVGFLEQNFPSYQTLDMHTNRLKKWMPVDCPKFQLNIQSLYAITGIRTRVVVIKCDESNVDNMNANLNDLASKEMIDYFPWNDFTCLPPEKRLTVVKDINKWKALHRNLFIDGFKDENDDVPMVYNNEAYPDNALINVGVSDYLENHVKTSTGAKLFEMVYGPVNGTREVIVKLDNFSQAFEFQKIAKGELAKQMDDEAISHVFSDPESVKTLRSQKKLGAKK
jgi:hypothetical protein